MARIVLAALFSLLLVGMQREMLVHEVLHLHAQVQRMHGAGLSKTANADCLECALLASGSNAVPTPAAAAVAVVPPATLSVSARDAAVGCAAPVYYQSRAPPCLL